MDIQALVGVLLGFGMCVLVPLSVAIVILVVTSKRARNNHAERMAMIEKGIVPPGVDVAPAAVVTGQTVSQSVRRPYDPWRSVGLAAGFLVAGLLWLFGLSHFGAILVGIGVAYLTRGVLGIMNRSDRSEGDVR